MRMRRTDITSRCEGLLAHVQILKSGYLSWNTIINIVVGIP